MDFPDPVIENRHRAQVQGRPGKAGRRPGQDGRRGSVLHRLHRPGVGPDDHEGHGRAAPGHQGRHPAAAPTRSTPISARRRWPIARASAARPTSTTPTRSRPAVRASSPASRCMFEPGEPGSGFVFETRSSAATVPKEFIPGVEKGLTSAKENGLLAGFPVIDFKATPDRRRLPRRRLLGAGLRNRRPRGLPRTARKGRAQAARADHEGRSA